MVISQGELQNPYCCIPRMLLLPDRTSIASSSPTSIPRASKLIHDPSNQLQPGDVGHSPARGRATAAPGCCGYLNYRWGKNREIPADAYAQSGVLPGGHTPETRGPFHSPLLRQLSHHQSYDSQIYDENCSVSKTAIIHPLQN